MLKVIVTVLFALDSLAMVSLVLIQLSKHGSLGGAFGGGGTHTIFGREERPDPKRTATIWLSAGYLGLALLLSLI